VLVLRYISTRLLSYLLIIFVGITIVFIVPRFTPVSAAEAIISQAYSQGSFLDPAAAEAMRENLLESFGLQGSLLEQYSGFWSRAITGNFGPSFSVFPTPVSQLILEALPWTVSLLVVASLIAWLFGNLLGLFAGYFDKSPGWRVLEAFAVAIYPVPYYILGLALILFVSSVFPNYPIGIGGVAIGLEPGLSLEFLLSAVQNALLPALSIVLVSYGWWFLSMKALTQSLKHEDHVVFAETMGLKRRTVLGQYILRNAMLPQVTQLAMSLGTVFSGALLTEVLFAYPGLGSLLYTAAAGGDYNLLVGIAALSVVAVATAGLLLDLFYPLLDPRVRYA
jgi:peptide/nickel transport system permease protein